MGLGPIDLVSPLFMNNFFACAKFLTVGSKDLIQVVLSQPHMNKIKFYKK